MCRSEIAGGPPRPLIGGDVAGTPLSTLQSVAPVAGWRGHGRIPRTGAGGGDGVAGLGFLSAPPLELIDMVEDEEEDDMDRVEVDEGRGTLGAVARDAGEFGTTRAGEGLVERRMVSSVVRSPRRK